MIRLLLLLVVIAVIIYLLIKLFRKRISNESVVTHTDDMVRCHYCGTHLPKGECVVHEGNCYCTEAHKRAHLDKSQ